ncbi:MAG TPA: hypothetical protein VNS58_07635 [Puia sp.]|nr:hypothetical protein [Puia sp.]
MKSVTASKVDPKIYFWSGSINPRIPIFVWLAEKDSILQGTVTYTKTKNKTPIKLIGQISTDGQIRVCEYQKDGTISGIFAFDKLDVAANGMWLSTTHDKEFSFELTARDTILLNIDTGFQPVTIPGEYVYMYGTEGSQGYVSIKKIKDIKISFEIQSVTSAPGRNLAEVDLDTVALRNNQFVYKLRHSKECQFQVKFYNNFLVVRYLKDYGDCGDIFGMNATVDGIFYKTPDKLKTKK